MSIYCCKDLEYKCKDFDNCEVVKVEEPLDSRILLCYDGGTYRYDIQFCSDNRWHWMEFEEENICPKLLRKLREEQPYLIDPEFNN